MKPGDAFPAITVTPVDGAHYDRPTTPRADSRSSCLTVARGTPTATRSCAFQRAQDKLRELDIPVVALWVDDADTTRGLVAEHGLEFRVGHSADAHAIAEATGAFVNADPIYLQSTGFVLTPDGKMLVSVYSSGAIGRLVPEDVAGLIKYVR